MPHERDGSAIELRRRLGLLTEDEVAAIADVDQRTLANQRSARSGPPFLVWGRKPFYRIEALTKWLAEREQETQK
jgi:hypothetical protein